MPPARARGSPYCHGYGSADVIARVNQYLQATSLSAESVSTVVGATQTLDLGASCVRVVPVTVSYVHQYTFVGGIISYFNKSLGSKTLSATSSMRLENAAAPCPVNTNRIHHASVCKESK